ncbi:MAG TPA: dihydrofolate reductase [Eubacteriales bacterium]|jgi:dihydrofolate reductase|nr:dihydrofolate reductase [Clostridia bacterium]HRR90235.1 dihydrofolate reductase [Eubacteriales bacterium]HRU84297.1 dihydrofolate reductase [Eubacteriales bacterium]
MKVIAIVDKKWGIGKNNDLLFSIKEDMRHFMKHTLGKVVVMGRNTLLSFPGGKPLKNRVNIVLWPDGEKRDDCIIVESLEELLVLLKNYPTDDVFIIGGAMFYRTMLPYCGTALITKVEADGGAEVFFENLDELENWKLISKEPPIEADGYIIAFTEYKNLSPKPY